MQVWDDNPSHALVFLLVNGALLLIVVLQYCKLRDLSMQ